MLQKLKLFVTYFVTLIALGILDFLWLGVITKDFYRQNIGHLFRSEMQVIAIIAFYLIYAGIITYFLNTQSPGSWQKALVLGAVIGFTAYMTYDLVNFATLKDWPFRVVIIDIFWGTFMTGIVASVAYLIPRP